LKENRCSYVRLSVGGNTTTNRAVVGIAGEALRLNGQILKALFTRGGTLQRVLLRYTEALITQISLTAACNRRHRLEKRLCRWLLLLHDRANSDEFVMTQEFIANMLGGRRETVTVAAGNLQDAGLIHYTRGHLKIIDREGLEKTACECCRAVQHDGQLMNDHKKLKAHHYLQDSPFRTRASNVLS
jgi:Crp-like helix-turn-helix domain